MHQYHTPVTAFFMPLSQGMEHDEKTGDTVASLKSPLSAQVTFCSSTDSDCDGCFSRDSTVSTYSAVACRSSSSRGTLTSKHDIVRERYFHRLGICAASIDRRDSLNQRTLTASQTFTSSCSAPGRKIGYQARQSSSREEIPPSTTASHEDCSRHDKIILLRRSVQYTTTLKSDPNGDDANSTAAPRVSLSEFDLSSAWASLLSNDTASTASSSTLDGAFDLFSLPSDSSIAFGRRDSTKSFDIENMAQELRPSRVDLSLSFISKQRKVSFDSTVKTATIPSRRSYSDRIKSRIWSSSEEIYANCFRNVREYEYDGKNWRTVKEECDFLRCASANRLHLVHPAHFSGLPPSLSPWQIEQYAIFNSGSDVSSIPNEIEVGGDPDGIFY